MLINGAQIPSSSCHIYISIGAVMEGRRCGGGELEKPSNECVMEIVRHEMDRRRRRT